MTSRETLHVGDKFDTPYETGCIVTSLGDDGVGFEGIDSDGIACLFSYQAVVRVSCLHSSSQPNTQADPVGPLDGARRAEQANAEAIMSTIHVGDIVRDHETGAFGTVTTVCRSAVYFDLADDSPKGVGMILARYFLNLEGIGIRADVVACDHATDEVEIAPIYRDLIRTHRVASRQHMALDTIAWMARSYIVGNLRSTEQDLRRVLTDIGLMVQVASATDDTLPELKASYQDASGEIFPPAYR